MEKEANLDEAHVAINLVRSIKSNVNTIDIIQVHLHEIGFQSKRNALDEPMQ
jgi:DNA-binding transcriptional regulator WhiA